MAFPCTFCRGREFDSTEAFRYHVKNSPGHPYCSDCDRPFPDYHGYLAHCDTKHPSLHRCCNKKFRTLSALNHHYYTSRRHPKCAICEKGFRTEGVRDKHQREAHVQMPCFGCHEMVYPEHLEDHYWESENHPSCPHCTLPKGFEDDAAYEHHRQLCHSWIAAEAQEWIEPEPRSLVDDTRESESGWSTYDGTGTGSPIPSQASSGYMQAPTPAPTERDLLKLDIPVYSIRQISSLSAYTTAASSIMLDPALDIALPASRTTSPDAGVSADSPTVRISEEGPPPATNPDPDPDTPFSPRAQDALRADLLHFTQLKASAALPVHDPRLRASPVIQSPGLATLPSIRAQDSPTSSMFPTSAASVLAPWDFYRLTRAPLPTSLSPMPEDESGVWRPEEDEGGRRPEEVALPVSPPCTPDPEEGGAHGDEDTPRRAREEDTPRRVREEEDTPRRARPVQHRGTFGEELEREVEHPPRLPSIKPMKPLLAAMRMQRGDSDGLQSALSFRLDASSRRYSQLLASPSESFRNLDLGEDEEIVMERVAKPLTVRRVERKPVPSTLALTPELSSSSSTGSSQPPFRVHCRICLADPCVQPTATFCGHVFCNACITQHVVETSRCAVCSAATLLYCLFRLDLVA